MLWEGLGSSLLLCVVTVAIMLVLMVPTMVIVHIRSRRLERAIEWVATLPLTIPRDRAGGGSGTDLPMAVRRRVQHRPRVLCFAYVVLVMPFAFDRLRWG